VHSFRVVAEEWIEKQAWATSTAVRNKRILGHLYRGLGASADAAVSGIEPSDFLNALRKLEDRPETAHRARSLGSAVFQYAIATGSAKYDPAAGLTKALTSPAAKNRPAVADPKKFGQLLRDIDNYQGQPVTRAALRLIALTFVRPGEMRLARWREFDLKKAQWEIPAERTKTRKPHLVPLSRQAVAVLKGLSELTGKAAEDLVFPSLRRGRPLSENTLGVALKTLGYDGNTHVAHGFRSSASTLLHELGFFPEVIETQLAHARPGVGGIYNRSHLLAQRKKMMKSWATYLDRLKREL
jgi:integrase